MSDQQENNIQIPDEENDDVQQSQTGSSLMSKLKVVGLVVAVVVVECAFAYMLIPTAVADSQTSEAAIKAAEAELKGGEEKGAEVENEVEVDLGEFRVTSYQPATDTTFRVNFHLYGTIVEEDQDEFEILKQANEARLREQVNVIVRAAEIPDLTDPTLGLIKRRILDKINRILGKQVVKGVIFSDMSFVEQ
ncbi:MAG: hypothetical protein JXM70_28980 [Pirellulales bacterium]|nr:hypothetical protein [Pirellulales bacterium]